MEVRGQSSKFYSSSKILIVGANFENKGAQSMLFITVDELKKRIPGCEVFFAGCEVFDENKYAFHEVFYSEPAKSIALGNNAMMLETKCFIKDCVKFVVGKRNNLFRFNEIKNLIKKINIIIDVSGFNIGKKWQENASLASKDSDADTYYAEMFDSIFGILVGIMALLIAATPILFWLLIRGDYKEAYYQMPILFMGMLFSSMASFIGGIYVAHKKTRSVGVTTILAAACNLVIDLVFVHKIGIFAASISTLVSYVFLTIYRMVDVQKFQKVKFNTGRFCLLIALLVLMCAICWIDTVALNFSDKPVELESVENAVKLAQYTPSACNRQGWKTTI